MSKINSKETKNYYGSDRLNKGYKEPEENNYNEKPPVNSIVAKKYEYLLPPVEVISQYEEIYPGALDKILKMAEREQEQKFLIEKASMAAYEKSRRLGAIFGLFTAVIICGATLELSRKDLNTALIFAFIAFASIFGISLVSSLKRSGGDRSRNYNKPQVDNQESRDNNRPRNFSKRRRR